MYLKKRQSLTEMKGAVMTIVMIDVLALIVAYVFGVIIKYQFHDKCILTKLHFTVLEYFLCLVHY